MNTMRQRGDYEVDVAAEIVLGGRIKFLLIVNSKNWERPVDRPVVQKLTQSGRFAMKPHSYESNQERFQSRANLSNQALLQEASICISTRRKSISRFSRGRWLYGGEDG